MEVQEVKEVYREIREARLSRWRKISPYRGYNIIEFYTQEKIEEVLNEPRGTIKDILKGFGENGKIAETAKMTSFEPKIYNLWQWQNCENDLKNSQFGTMPLNLIENLLYYYTKPFDVVFDPFGGSGVTITACKKYYRRYYGFLERC